ncbi:hypothetical protein QCB52_10315, partial [Myroides odoratimimus]
KDILEKEAMLRNPET